MRLRAERWRFLGVLALAVAVVAAGWIRVAAGDAPGARAAVECLIALCGIVAMALTGSRFAATRELRELLLLGATSVLTVAGLVAYLLPAALGIRGGPLAGTGPLGELIAAAAFALYTRVPPGRLAPAGRGSALIAAGAGAGVVLLAALLAWPLTDQLTATGGHARSGLSGAPVLAVALGMIAAAVMLPAAVSLMSRGAGALLPWGLALLGASDLYRLTLPLLPADWISMREVIRLGALLLILGAALQEERRARREASRLAALAQRQLVARDLHDGIAQDLAFIAAYSDTLGGQLGEHPVRVAALRALAVTRGVINDLSDFDGRPTPEALAIVASELSTRFSISVAVDVAADTDLPRNVGHDLVRMAREAIVNAARHGSAEHVTVTIGHDDAGTVLRVRDDGSGIVADDGSRAPEGFGLSSIREQATAMGGQLTVCRRPRGGTELTVELR